MKGVMVLVAGLLTAVTLHTVAAEPGTTTARGSDSGCPHIRVVCELMEEFGNARGLAESDWDFEHPESIPGFGPLPGENASPRLAGRTR